MTHSGHCRSRLDTLISREAGEHEAQRARWLFTQRTELANHAVVVEFGEHARPFFEQRVTRRILGR